MILLTFVDPDCKVDHAAGEGILVECIPGFVLHAADDAAADDVHSRSMREQAAHTCAAGNSHGDEDRVEEVGASGVREEPCLRACALRDPGAGTHGDLPVVSWHLPPRLPLLLSLPDSYRCAYRLLSHSTAFPQH
jgi:hypothetical protein